MTVLVIPADAREPFRLDDIDDANQLKAMQTIVGGAIELIGAHPDVHIWCNEDGIHRRLPANQRATTLLRHFIGAGAVTLLGTVFLSGPADGEGNTLSVSQVVIDAVNRLRGE